MVEPEAIITTLTVVIKAIVDKPESVVLSSFLVRDELSIRISAAPEDIGKFVGMGGRTMNALRAITAAIGMRAKLRIKLHSDNYEHTMSSQREA